MAGLTPQGLVVKRLVDIIADLRAAVKSSPALGSEIAVGDESALGQLLGVGAVALEELHSLTQQVYDASRLDGAEGVALDGLVAFGGITREAATYSVGTVTATGDSGTVIPAGSKVRVPNGPTFETLTDATIGGGGTVDVDIQALETGPVEAGAGTITEIVNAVAGWTAVTNAADVEEGEDEEKDAELLARYQRSLNRVGAANDSAIRARVEELPDITAAAVISNRSMVTDGNGIPAKAFLTVVWPTVIDEQRLADTLWDIGGTAGMELYGTKTADVLDDRGNEQQVGWSYASAVDIYITANVTTDSDYPGNGDDLVEEVLLTYEDELSVGDDVLPTRLVCLAGAVTGVRDVKILVQRNFPPGGGDDSPVSINITEIARLDAARITVNS